MSTGREEKSMILVHVAVEPHNVPKFLAAFHTCFQECKKEPELERFEVFDTPANEGEFYWIETWRGDREWFSNVSRTYQEDITSYRLLWENLHQPLLKQNLTFFKVQMNRSYYGPYLAETQPLWIKPRKYKSQHDSLFIQESN